MTWTLEGKELFQHRVLSDAERQSLLNHRTFSQRCCIGLGIVIALTLIAVILVSRTGQWAEADIFSLYILIFLFGLGILGSAYKIRFVLNKELAYGEVDEYRLPSEFCLEESFYKIVHSPVSRRVLFRGDRYIRFQSLGFPRMVALPSKKLASLHEFCRSEVSGFYCFRELTTLEINELYRCRWIANFEFFFSWVLILTAPVAYWLLDWVTPTTIHKFILPFMMVSIGFLRMPDRTLRKDVNAAKYQHSSIVFLMPRLEPTAHRESEADFDEKEERQPEPPLMELIGPMGFIWTVDHRIAAWRSLPPFDGKKKWAFPGLLLLKEPSPPN